MSKKPDTIRGYVMAVDQGEIGEQKYYTFINDRQKFLESYKLKGLIFKDTKLEDITALGEFDFYSIASCRPDGDISILINFREGVGSSGFYSRYATYEDIENLLNNNYFVAVKGLGEIDSIEDLN